MTEEDSKGSRCRVRPNERRMQRTKRPREAAMVAAAASSAATIGRSKMTRCGQCSGCLLKDCGKCQFCLDKPKFGGPALLRQACLERRKAGCTNPIMPLGTPKHRYRCRSKVDIAAHLSVHPEHVLPGLTCEQTLAKIISASPSSQSIGLAPSFRGRWAAIETMRSGRDLYARGLKFGRYVANFVSLVRTQRTTQRTSGKKWDSAWYFHDDRPIPPTGWRFLSQAESQRGSEHKLVGRRILTWRAEEVGDGEAVVLGGIAKAQPCFKEGTIVRWSKAFFVVRYDNEEVDQLEDYRFSSEACWYVQLPLPGVAVSSQPHQKKPALPRTAISGRVGQSGTALPSPPPPLPPRQHATPARHYGGQRQRRQCEHTDDDDPDYLERTFKREWVRCSELEQAGGAPWSWKGFSGAALSGVATSFDEGPALRAAKEAKVAAYAGDMAAVLAAQVAAKTG